MKRTRLARRYGPFAALAALQLLLIATVPSVAPKVVTELGAGVGSSGSGADGTTGVAGSAADTATSTVGGAASVAGGAGGGGGTAPGAPPGVPPGDTSHCVRGRQWDPAIAYWAPPCVPGLPGAAFANNGGATSMGVTASKITIVDYVGDAGAEVDAILKAQGLYVSYQDAQTIDKVYEAFINKHYTLFGRSVNIVTYQGQCTTVPPDTNCLIPEMDKIAAQYKPYALFWTTTLCSQCFAELARDKVVTVGGAGFSDSFSNQNAPYVYSAGESSTRVEQAFADFYCKQLATSPVKFAGTKNPAQNFNGQKRELGIISTNDPDNETTVEQVLVPALKACGVNVSHFYYYAQDINTAAQQTAAGIAAMDTPTNPATTVLCLCDPVAPQFLYQGEQSNNYWPENVLATDQGMDLDKAAQSYEGGIACAGDPCEFDVAFGIGPEYPQEPASNNAGTRIYAAGGGTNLPVDPVINQIYAQNYVMLANLIENTGPTLTPARMQSLAPSLPAIGGGNQSSPTLLQFSANNWQWAQDNRVFFWSKTSKSSYNGVAGTFFGIEGQRFRLGQFPKLTQPPIPSPRP